MRVFRSRDKILEIDSKSRRDQNELIQDEDDIAMINFKESETCARLSRIL